MTVFILVVVFCLWCGLFVWVGTKALDAAFEYNVRTRVFWFSMVILTIALPASIIDSFMDDEHANQLCLRGHQEWVTRMRPGGLVGKVYVPGGPYTSKQWICDQWERAQ